MTSIKIFRPCEELFLNLAKNNSSFGVLLLNSPVKLNNIKLRKIWNQANIRVLVDGGSECWMNWKENLNKKKDDLYMPHLLTGDFDSISTETLEKLKKINGVQVIHTPDQEETDFTKALEILNDYKEQKKIEIDKIYVLTEIAGRLDHLMANINTLYRSESILPNTSVFLLCSDSFSWLLKPGTYKISIPEILRENKNWCSLVPIGSPAVVTTSGLKWNLDKTKLEFGGLISTSNSYNGSAEVEIETSSCLLWTMSTRGLL
ncbi:thiamin pyrophosphokinase 1-like isoform X2 [Harmonia axyridis]|uniref:thiamin pyrophosphokinase 1-like isoform X2 n=1 Tax=Harmonia axyridis TaxID=115357 RepID=UPI001E276254|nr:thiamin pyrophosphokinase 1-like isoform X2 [Harmonia axyridis]